MSFNSIPTLNVWRGSGLSTGTQFHDAPRGREPVFDLGPRGPSIVNSVSMNRNQNSWQMTATTQGGLQGGLQAGWVNTRAHAPSGNGAAAWSRSEPESSWPIGTLPWAPVSTTRAPAFSSWLDTPSFHQPRPHVPVHNSWIRSDWGSATGGWDLDIRNPAPATGGWRHRDADAPTRPELSGPIDEFPRDGSGDDLLDRRGWDRDDGNAPDWPRDAADDGEWDRDGSGWPEEGADDRDWGREDEAEPGWPGDDRDQPEDGWTDDRDGHDDWSEDDDLSEDHQRPDDETGVPSWPDERDDLEGPVYDDRTDDRDETEDDDRLPDDETGDPREVDDRDETEDPDEQIDDPEDADDDGTGSGPGEENSGGWDGDGGDGSTPVIDDDVIEEPVRNDPELQQQVENVRFLNSIISNNTPNPDDMERVVAIYQEFRLPESELTHLNDIAQRASARMFEVNDGAFSNYARNWSRLTASERRSVMSDIFSEMRDELGLQTNIGFYDEPPRTDGAASHGQYNPTNDTVSVNTNASVHATLPEAMSTMFHELVHAYYFQRTAHIPRREIGDRVENGEMTYAEALVHLNVFPPLYLSENDFGLENYKLNPHEQLAFSGQFLFDQEMIDNGYDIRRNLESDNPLFAHLRGNGLA